MGAVSLIRSTNVTTHNSAPAALPGERIALPPIPEEGVQRKSRGDMYHTSGLFSIRVRHISWSRRSSSVYTRTRALS